jgi:predicted MPP superfamily phosphohydrolase
MSRPRCRSGKTLCLGVVSDLHVYSNAEPGKAPSYLQTEEMAKNLRESPLLSLELLIEEQGLQADVLLSPGDLCNRADSQGLKFGWRRIKEIASKLKASRVIATVGNHDVDSRNTNSTDSWSELKGLTAFPVDHASLSNEYWARHFTVIADNTPSDYRIVSLNSSAHHGQIDIEKNHGRIDQATLTELQRRLDTEPP